MTERGLTVDCLVHDAFPLEAPIDDVDDIVDGAQSAMAEASRAVLDGYEVKTDAEVTKWPGSARTCWAASIPCAPVSGVSGGVPPVPRRMTHELTCERRKPGVVQRS